MKLKQLAEGPTSMMSSKRYYNVSTLKFFRQLEKEGKLLWPQPAGARLIYILENYSIGALLPTTANHESDERNRARVRKAARSLRDALTAFPAGEQAIFAIRLTYAPF